jgi:hypothetical protein
LGVAEAVIRHQNGGEVLFRAAMTAGMVLSCGQEGVELAKTLEIESWLAEAKKKNGEARISDVVGECINKLKR